MATPIVSLSIFKEVVAFIIRFSCIPLLIRKFYAQNKVSILLYHSPKPEVLDRHLNYLSKHFNFITLDFLVNALYSKDWSNIPHKSLVITIDDGFKENFNLLEIFKKYKVVPTIYLCSQIVNTNRQFWFNVHGINIQALKKISNEERLQLLNKNFGFKSSKEYPEVERQALNGKELMLMKDFIDFQSHTLFHPNLTTCSKEECKKEIFQSKQDIETLLETKCKHFVYPNGDYTKREIELVKDAGYLSARTIDVGWNGLNTDPYRLKITCTIKKMLQLIYWPQSCVFCLHI